MLLQHINRRTLQRFLIHNNQRSSYTTNPLLLNQTTTQYHQQQQRWQPQPQPQRSHLSTAATTDDDDSTNNPNDTPPPPISPSEASQTYNNRRASYKRAVSSLRTQYHQVVIQQRATEESKRLSHRESELRRKAERQRLKDIQSVKNALRGEERRRVREKEFREDLEVSSRKREDRLRWFEKGRGILLDELEEESKDWMATHAEIDEAFRSPATTQHLWATPGGYIGTPSPTSDTQYWSMESHTWDMSSTYKTPRDLLWEDLEKHWYETLNVDEEYWTHEKLAAKEELSQKAKLRALVRDEGRKVLLMKQRGMMQDVMADRKQTDLENGIPGTPDVMPTPSLDVLGNWDAMEREGARLIEEDPTKFFVFDSNAKPEQSNDNDDDDDDANGTPNDKQSSPSSSSSNNKTTNLGKPTRLVDPLRDNSPTNTPFPQTIARSPRIDTRSTKQKKKEEKERKMWAAAQTSDEAAGIEFAAEDDKLYSPLGKDIDYDEVGNVGDMFDREWEEGLDPVRDREVLETPREERYTGEDIDWVIGRLEEKIRVQEQITRLEGDDREDGDGGQGGGGGGEDISQEEEEEDYELSDEEISRALGGVVPRKPTTSTTTTSVTVPENLQNLVDTDRIDSVLSNLDETQIQALQALDSDQMGMSADEIKKALGKVPGLSEEQVDSLVELELSLSSNDELVKELANDNDDGRSGGGGD